LAFRELRDLATIERYVRAHLPSGVLTPHDLRDLALQRVGQPMDVVTQRRREKRGVARILAPRGVSIIAIHGRSFVSLSSLGASTASRQSSPDILPNKGKADV
jgi:hypothetical protein